MQLLTEKEASDLLAVSVHTLRTWRMSKTGPSYTKLGRLIRYRKDVLEKFIEDGETKPREKV